MTIFEMGAQRMARLASVSLAEAAVHERRDLQRLLRAQLPELVPDVLVIAEEFGDWEDSRRRIDLLGIDRDANLVVIELKRGDTGVHMELQAVRYAAMVSTMTFEQAVETFARHLQAEAGADARSRLLEFLGWSEANDDDFAQDVKIVLMSEDYSRELTSSILWLNGKGLEITCFRMAAYRLEGKLLVDFQQIIPLKEAEEYQVKLRNKQLVEHTARLARVPWNGEFYANFGDTGYRSWDDAREYGFISAGGGEWFTRTLKMLIPGKRVWVNCPGSGYVGVGIVMGEPVAANEFEVETTQGRRLYLDIGQISQELRANANDSERTERFVSIKWIATVPEAQAIREIGLFGNQNSVAKPTAASWPTTVARLKDAFGVND